MSSPWNTDLEKGLQSSAISTTPPLDSSNLPECLSPSGVKDPSTSSSSREESHLHLSYGDRLVYNFLAPRRHPMFNNMNYDEKIIQATRFRHLNIARIQHDLFRLQHVLTRPGGGTEENFARLSSLLHEHGMMSKLLSTLII